MLSIARPSMSLPVVSPIASTHEALIRCYMKNLQNIPGSAGSEFFARARRASKAGKAYYALPDMAAMQEVSK